MKKLIIMVLLILVSGISGAYAGEAEEAPSPDAEEAEAVQSEVYIFPVIKPEFSLTGGYRYVHANGSSRAEEFEYLHNSLVLGGELRTVSLKHRLHLDFEVRNEKDYYGDISYAYKDLVLFRAVNSTLFHNLENIKLFTFGGMQAERRDLDEKYGLKVGISNILLRFKTPDFPAHLYFEGNFVDKDGAVQQKFYKYSSPSARISEKRDVDLQTSVYTLGANSHLGPVEVDFSHSEKRLDVGADKALIDADVRGIPGTYYHNRIPELKSSANTLKLHTSFTGGLVASATLSKTDKENRDSGAKADYLFVAGDVTWMPMTKLTFFVKYRHQERDLDSPDTVTIRNLVAPFNTTTMAVKDSISSISDAVSGTVRYRPFKGVMLKADYTYEDIRRNDAEEWHVIPDSTQRHKLSLSGDIRIMSGLKLNAKYIHRDINNPSTNIEPDRSDEGIMTLSWMPFPRLNTFLSYGIKEEKRESLRFLNGTEVLNADNRKAKNDRLVGTVSYVLLRNLSVTGSYAYMHNNVTQDIIYAADTNHPPILTGKDLVPYKTISRNYSFDINYSPKSFISLNGGISHTISKGTFYPSDAAITQPESIASFSELKIRETTYSASGEYQFKSGFTAGIQYRYTTFKDVLDNIYDDANDGRASIILLTISKKW
jgi:predicted porin